MNMHILLFASFLFSVFVITGCSNELTPPPTGPEDRSMVDYSFVDVTENCQLYKHIDLDETGSPCIGNQTENVMFYTDEFEWTIMCCDFSSKCTETSALVDEYNSLCSENTQPEYTGYIYNDNGYWLAQCCTSSGGSCYVDLYINVSDDTSVCDEDYHYNTYSVGYNGSNWNAMCCIGGIEE